MQRTSLSDRVELAVNVGSGNLLLTSKDLAITGTGLSLAVTRTYNSRSTTSGSFGNRWTLDSGRDVRLDPSSGGAWTFKGPGGFAARFTPNGTAGTYVAPASFHDADLTNIAGSQHELRFHDDGEVLRFEAGGRLVEDRSRHGQTRPQEGPPAPRPASPTEMRASRSFRPKRTDAQGNAMAMAYNATGDLLSSTTSNPASTQRRTYQGDGTTSCGGQAGQVCTETTAKGGVTSYGYDALGNLNRVSPPPPLGAQVLSMDGQ